MTETPSGDRSLCNLLRAEEASVITTVRRWWVSASVSATATTSVLINRYQPRREWPRAWKDSQGNNPDLSDGHTWCFKMFERLVELLPSRVRPLSPLSPALGRSMAQREVGFLIELFWWAGGWFNEARSCFHPDLSGWALQVSILWLKRKVWACRSTPEVSDLTKLLCRVWHFLLNGIHPAHSFCSHYTQSPVFPSPHGILQQDEQDVLWWRCQWRAHHLSEVVKPDIFHWEQSPNKAIIWHTTETGVVTEYTALTKVLFI